MIGKDASPFADMHAGLSLHPEIRRCFGWMPVCVALMCVLFVGGCSPDEAGVSRVPDGSACVLLTAHELPGEVRETSGIAVGHVRESRLWTHNDRGHDAVLYGLDVTGEIRATVRIDDAESIDWEDVDVGACPSGSCIYIGDIGDNDAERDFVTVYRIPEPASDDIESLPAERLDLRYADGPVDAESMAVADDGSIVIITKGREGDIRLYQTPPAPAFGGPVLELEPLETLLPAPRQRDDRATAAAFSPDGTQLFLRTYRHIHVYAWPELSPGATFDIEHLSEPQGEAIDVLPDGTIVLTSEAGRSHPPVMRFISCESRTTGVAGTE